jgi:signal transduction histidine kinase
MKVALETVSEGMHKRLLHYLSHDLRSPLVNAQGVLNMFNSGLLSGKHSRPLFEELESEFMRMSNLLENLYHWIEESTYQEKEDAGVADSFKLHELVGDIVEEYCFPIKRKNIRMVNAIDPDIRILFNKNKLHVLLRNLMSNAIKFNKINGSVMLTVGKPREGYVQIFIEDTGIGMSDTEISKILSAEYYRNTGTIGEKGYGLGLLFCRAIIKRAGGTLEIISEKDRGTKISFTMPCCMPPAP